MGQVLLYLLKFTGKQTLQYRKKLILVVTKVCLTVVIRRLINSGLDRWGYFSNITSLGVDKPGLVPSVSYASALAKQCVGIGPHACHLTVTRQLLHLWPHLVKAEEKRKE